MAWCTSRPRTRWTSGLRRPARQGAGRRAGDGAELLRRGRHAHQRRRRQVRPRRGGPVGPAVSPGWGRRPVLIVGSRSGMVIPAQARPRRPTLARSSSCGTSSREFSTTVSPLPPGHASFRAIVPRVVRSDGGVLHACSAYATKDEGFRWRLRPRGDSFRRVQRAHGGRSAGITSGWR